MKTRTCPKCSKPHSRPHAYCADCKAEYAREYRKTHNLPEKQKIRSNARSYANTYLRRGKLTKKPCEYCGDLEVQMHHEDYSQPLLITWLCKECHKNYHDLDWVDWDVKSPNFRIKDFLEQQKTR